MNFPNVKGQLNGWPSVFIVGSSPSMDEIQNVWAQLDTVYTVAINRSWLTKPGPRQEVLFMPSWWVITDSQPLDGSPPLVNRDIAWKYLGIRLWHWASVASKHADMPAVPWHHVCEPGFETERLDRIRQYKTSDNYALQILGGIMGARTFYLVGIDHGTHGKATHAGGEERTGHGFPDRHGPQGIGAGYKAVKAWMSQTGANVYTCSPWGDSYTREFFEYVPFDEAVSRAHKEMANR